MDPMKTRAKWKALLKKQTAFKKIGLTRSNSTIIEEENKSALMFNSIKNDDKNILNKLESRKTKAKTNTWHTIEKVV